MEFLSLFSKIFLKRLKKLLNIFAHFGNNFLNQKIYSWNLSAIILILFTSWALAKPPRSGVKYETASILHINAIKAPVASDESIWNSDNLNSFRWHKKRSQLEHHQENLRNIRFTDLWSVSMRIWEHYTSGGFGVDCWVKQWDHWDYSNSKATSKYSRTWFARWRTGKVSASVRRASMLLPREAREA